MGHKISIYSRLSLKIVAIFGIREKFLNFCLLKCLNLVDIDTFKDRSMSMSMSDNVSMSVYRPLWPKMPMS